MNGHNHKNVNNPQRQATPKAPMSTGGPMEANLIQETLDHEQELKVDSMAYFGLSEIAEQLSHIHNSLKSYNVNACGGEMSFSVGLYTGTNQDPVRLVLEGDAVETIADSLKRIADAMTASTAK
jgi:hypothetical protein